MLYFLFRYFIHELVSKGAVDKGIISTFYASYLEAASKSCMFTEEQREQWTTVHVLQGGWYIKCPVDACPLEEEALKSANSGNQAPMVEVATDCIAGGSSQTPPVQFIDLEDTPNDPKPRKSRRSLRKTSQLPNDVSQGAPASVSLVGESSQGRKRASSGRDLSTPPHPPKVLKQYVGEYLHLIQLVRPNVISRSHDSIVFELVLNDTPAQMLDFKKTTHAWPPSYVEMTGFLDKVSECLLVNFPCDYFLIYAEWYLYGFVISDQSRSSSLVQRNSK